MLNKVRHVLLLIIFWTSLASMAAETAEIPAGDYALDRTHASLLFRINHLGFSMFTASFDEFDATLYFDPQKMGESRVQATVDATSIKTGVPISEALDFDAILRGPEWLDVAVHPQMMFISRSVEQVSSEQVRVHGDFTLRGITRPLVLDVTFNGGYAGQPMDPNARIGFSARGRLLRSDYAMSFGIPAPGSSMGVGDQVDIIIEAEFTGPPLHVEQ